ncbi:MAG: hypothetical protein ABSE48_22755, partial [Verrucomicrobiota bacterium]
MERAGAIQPSTRFGYSTDRLPMDTIATHRTVGLEEPIRAPAPTFPPSTWHWGNRRTRLTIESILLGLAILLAVTWFSTPYFIRDYINRSLSGLPDYSGRVERVRLHPWTASLDIYDVHIDKKTGEIPVHFFYSPRWNISLQWS